jgi:N-formylglutamate deformylase
MRRIQPLIGGNRRRFSRDRPGYQSSVPPAAPASFSVSVSPGQLVSTAIHAGHDLRSEVAGRMALDDATRRREEDPYTDEMLGDLGVRIVAHRSRFEVDLNRSRDAAVYVSADDAWGLDVWRGELPQDVVERSLHVYDEFYAELARHLDELSSHGPFLVLDVHSYNHRRDGALAAPADELGKPEVNVGTGPPDATRWQPAVDRFSEVMAAQTIAGRRPDVRENVRFRGGHMSRWVTERYPETGCVLSLEFKKVFMDEWTDVCDHAHVAAIRGALAATVQPTLDAIAQVS